MLAYSRNTSAYCIPSTARYSQNDTASAHFGSASHCWPSDAGNAKIHSGILCSFQDFRYFRQSQGLLPVYIWSCRKMQILIFLWKSRQIPDRRMPEYIVNKAKITKFLMIFCMMGSQAHFIIFSPTKTFVDIDADPFIKADIKVVLIGYTINIRKRMTIGRINKYPEQNFFFMALPLLQGGRPFRLLSR